MRAEIMKSEICGSVIVPPSKSMAHRALICAALAQGESRIEGIGFSDDIAATIDAVRRLGARVQRKGAGVLVRGTGGRVLCTAEIPVDCRESGSTLRFLLPLFSLSEKEITFTGKGRLMQRPQEIYRELFAQRGLCFDQDAEKIRICGALTAGEYVLSGNISSQFITGLLFALPLLKGESVIRILPPFESRSYVKMTLQVLAAFGISAQFTDENTVRIAGNQQYRPCRYTVEGDASQAAFFAVLGAVRGGITVGGLRADSLQGDRVIFDLLCQCGSVLQCTESAVSFEKAPLSGICIDLSDCPDLGPALTVLGCFCSGKTEIRNAGRLRLKESDRIAAMETELRKMGAEITAAADTVTVRQSALHGGCTLQGHGDHRVVMALCTAALAAGVPVKIEGAQAIGKSWPEFFSVLESLGAKVRLCGKPE